MKQAKNLKNLPAYDKFVLLTGKEPNVKPLMESLNIGFTKAMDFIFKIYIASPRDKAKAKKMGLI